MTKILAATYHTGGANAISPVIKGLESIGFGMKVIGYGTSGAVFQSNKIQYSEPSIDPYTERKDVSEEMMRSVIVDYRPDIVLTGRSCPDGNNPEVIDQTLILAARSLGVPVVSVTDLWTGNLEYFSDNRSNSGKLRYVPDHFTILDEYQKEIMIEEGFPEKNLVITGNPFFDSLAETKRAFTPERRIEVRNELGLDLDKKVILYASGPIEHYYGKDNTNPEFYGYTEKTVLSDMITALNTLSDEKRINLDNIEIFAKIHPNRELENPEEIEKILRSSGIKYVVSNQRYDGRTAALACDLTTSAFSTMGLEATLMGLNNLFIQPSPRREDPIVTNKLGITRCAYKTSEIAPALYESLSGKSTASGEIPYTLTDGKATDRVIGLVEKIISTRQ